MANDQSAKDSGPEGRESGMSMVLAVAVVPVVPLVSVDQALGEWVLL